MVRKVFRELMDQQQAKDIFYQYLPPIQPKIETVPLIQGLGRVLAEEIISSINVPPFNRAAMDGFAVLASDTTSASEDHPLSLNVIGEVKAGYVYNGIVQSGQAVEISTGAPMPIGTDAVVMVEFCTRIGNEVSLTQPVAPAENRMVAGADIQLGERIMPKHQVLSSRELAILAAIGTTTLSVLQKPKVGVFSSGDELVPPGSELLPGKLYDINSTSIITSIIENGGDPHFLGIIKDQREDIYQQLSSSLSEFDILIISGGTSAGMGDMLYEVIDELGEPGLLVHGVKVKPGKPTILGVCNSTPIIGLPGYPASALSIHQLFVLPLLRTMAGLPPQGSGSIVKAKVIHRLRSAEGRYEFKPVYLFNAVDHWLAFPVPGGSGAITSVALADGFIRIPENTHFIPANSEVEVHLITDTIKPPTIQIIGDDIALFRLQELFEMKYPQFHIRVIGVGTSDVVSLVKRGECHIAGIHQLDATKGYNTWLGDNSATVISGYCRMLVFAVLPGNPKQIYGLKDLVRDDVEFINMPTTSGSRDLLERMLQKIGIDTTQIMGYDRVVRSQNAAAQLVASGEVDVVVITEAVAQTYNLDTIELREEDYDFLVTTPYLNMDAIQLFIELLLSQEFKEIIKKLPGYRVKV